VQTWIGMGGLERADVARYPGQGKGLGAFFWGTRLLLEASIGGRGGLPAPHSLGKPAWFP